MTASDLAFMLFASCNFVRILAYVPQVAAIVRDKGGASGVSRMTWAMFGIANASTVAYALLCLGDGWMAAIFCINLVCCLTIVGLASVKRARFAARAALRPMPATP